MIFLSASLCVLIIYLGRGKRSDHVGLLSPIAMVGWFGLVYLIFPSVAINFDLSTKWSLVVNEEELFDRAQVPFIIFAMSAVIAKVLAGSGKKLRNQPVMPMVRPIYPHALLAVALASYLFLVLTGAANVTYSGADGSGGTDNKFLLSFVDLAIPAIALLLFNSDRHTTKQLLFMMFVVFVIYGLLGSRYRLVSVIILGVLLSLRSGYSLFSFRALTRIVGAFLAIALFSAGRTYRQGFNIEAIFNSDQLSIAEGLFNEANVHLAMGAITEYVPDIRPYDFWSPVLVAISSFVPRSLWPNKPGPEYLNAIPMALDPSLESSGAALPVYGEWYMMGGYVAVFVVGLLLLFLLQREYLRAWRQGKIGLAACIICYCAYANTRGYLAQNLLSFIFIVMPAYFGYFKTKKSST